MCIGVEEWSRERTSWRAEQKDKGNFFWDLLKTASWGIIYITGGPTEKPKFRGREGSVPSCNLSLQQKKWDHILYPQLRRLDMLILFVWTQQITRLGNREKGRWEKRGTIWPNRDIQRVPQVASELYRVLEFVYIYTASNFFYSSWRNYRDCLR